VSQKSQVFFSFRSGSEKETKPKLTLVFFGQFLKKILKNLKKKKIKF